MRAHRLTVRVCCFDGGPQANPALVFAEWMAKNKKGYANDAQVRWVRAAGPALGAHAHAPTN
jgi:hypothetical protein